MPNDPKDQYARLQNSPVQTNIPPMPPLPDDVKKRFPTMAQWERAMEEWRVKILVAVRGNIT